MSLLMLVRHGQASAGSADYDQLSPLGERQAVVVGAALGMRLPAPDLILQGVLRRHGQTTEGLVHGSHWTSRIETDPRWNEFDHDQMLMAAHPEYADRPALLRTIAGHQDPAAEFQRLFLLAADRWIGGQHDPDYPESFAAFAGRVAAAATEAVDRPGTVVVSTSGGPIAVLAAMSTLGTTQPSPELTHAWMRLNEVCVNTGVSKFLRGRRPSPTMLSFNDHSHLDHDRSLITYR